MNQMKAYGKFPTNESIMSKVLRSLSSRLEYVVPTIIESNDLSTYTFDEMMSLLMAHEDRFSKANEKAEEKAFQVKGESSEKGRSGYYGGRGYDRGRGGFHGRCRGYGRGRGYFGDQNQNQGSYGDQSHQNSQFKRNIQCRYCKKFWHKEAECWSKQRNVKKNQILLKMLKKKVRCSWRILLAQVRMMWYGFWIVVVTIIWQEQNRSSSRSMSQRRIKFVLEMTRH